MSGSEDPVIERLAASVPPAVRQICEQLEEAGHQAVTVGGAVRDAILGRVAGDWDVATSAKPDEVMALFRRTIPTGLQHGTVTVLTGAARGAPKEEAGVEVTTFRGEGAYSDGRRPDEVHFGVPLEEDLARRDLVVNAIAYSPARRQIIDPFGGREDLRLRRLRAVGVPLERFLEDGLRVMRAVRFAAALEFAIEAETEAALTPALVSLSKVSRERVTVELMKLLAAPRPSLGLAVAARRGVLENILPAVTEGLASWGRSAEELCRRVDEAAAEARLGALVMDVRAAPAAKGGGAGRGPAVRGYDRAVQQAVDELLRRLKMKNTDTEKAAQVAAAAAALEACPALDEEAVRRVLAACGRAHAAAVVEAWRADGVARPAGQGAALAELGRRVVARGDALSVGELAIAGADLIAELAMPAGAEIGRILRALLEQVLSDPTRNRRDTLLEAARAARAS
jgi:tRNA nucleotidyltransferase (CCA-adding enzyme)